LKFLRAVGQDGSMPETTPTRISCRVGLGCLLALASAPRESGAQLADASTGFAFARFFANAADVDVTVGSGVLAVALGATAVDVLDLPDDQWLADFDYEATLVGSGSVSWGQAAGALDLETSAVPELSLPAPGNPNDPLYNLDSAQAGGQVVLTFTELGTITSDTLPPGTPVEVALNGRVDSTSSVHGSLDAPNETRAEAGLEGRIIDNSGGFVGVEIFVASNEMETQSLASAVGHVLEIRGIFRVAAEAFAGGLLCCPGYTPEATAAVAGSGGLWLTLPAAVGFAASSGHDYTVPVPEPNPPALVLAAALALGIRAAAPGV
jgi:hypothetical protein